ncbi:MFS general substrate transporter [Nemania sp. FL0916]|nr:MFS general substrate transporter [Nemania sp. FL0916]
MAATPELQSNTAEEIDGFVEKAAKDKEADYQNESSPPSPPPPKEDLFAWSQVVAGFVINLNTWGFLNTFGVFQTFYQLHLLQSESSSNIAWIGSTQAFFLFLISLGAGPAFDRGYLRPLLWVGSALIILGMFLVGVSSQYYQVFLTQAVLMGLGFGSIYLPAPAVVSQYFDKRAALAQSLASTGSSIGGIIYPITFAQLQPRIGFGWATRVLGFIIVGTSAIPLLLMKSKASPKPSRDILDRNVFRDLSFILFVTGLFFGFMGFYVVFNYIQLFAIHRSISTASLDSYLLVIVNASSLVGRVIGGYYSDKIGSIHMQALVNLIAAILSYSLLAVYSTAGLVIYSVLFGAASGVFTGLPAAGVVTLSPDKSKIGTRLGLTLVYVGIGVLVGNPIAGAILGQNNNWVGLVVFCATLLFGSSVLILASRVAKVGTGFKHKL